MPLSDGLSIGLLGSFLAAKNETINITSLGKKIVSLWDKEEPNAQVIRQLIFPLILKLMPSWVTFSGRSLEERLISIPDRWKEVLNNGELLGKFLSDEAKKWWRDLQRAIAKIEEKFLKKIGDVGEILTLRYEKIRLTCEKHIELAEKIDWVAKENDGYGFDIASFFGYLLSDNKKPTDMIMIEVKSTTSNSENSFRLYISRNEWETAEDNMTNYFFYLWKGVKISKSNPIGDGPLILPARIISQYVPLDKHKRGKWIKCRIELDLNAIKPHLIGPDLEPSN